MDNTFDISSLYDQQVEAGFVSEATAFKTLPGGLYKGIATKVEGKVIPANWPNGEPTQTPGRNLVHLTMDLFDAESGAKKGKQFIDLAVPKEIYRFDPEAKRSVPEAEAGKGLSLDKESKLLGHALKATKTTGLGDLITALKENYVGIYVTESFKVTEGGVTKWKNARTEEERTSYVEAGFEPKNFIQSISELK